MCRSFPLTRGTHTRSAIGAFKWTVHPRLRGELGHRSHHRDPSRRFIPAYAGNSLMNRGNRDPLSVHPRLRGELEKSEAGLNFIYGSSPLTRGTLTLWGRLSLLFRFIPAYAGNSADEIDNGGIESGSSPLTRGTHLKTV